jgi:ribonuclease HI
MIEGWFDGACEPSNPGGHASCASLVRVDGQVVHQSGRYVGHGPLMSNNLAEYSGFIDAVSQVKKFPGPAIIRGDSRLVINQLLGRFKVRGGLYLPFYRKAARLFASERDRISLAWIPREQNEECDALTRDVLTDRGVELRLSEWEQLTGGTHVSSRELLQLPCWSA